MSWWAVGATVVGSLIGSQGAKSAASKSAQGSQAAIDEQRRQFDVAMGLQQPYAVTGTGALNQLAQLYGTPYQAYQAPNLSGGPSAGGSTFLSRDIRRMIQSGMSVEDIQRLGRFAPSAAHPDLSRNLLRNAGLSDAQMAELEQGSAGLPAAQGGPAGIVTPEGPDPSIFQNSPGYNFRRQEGQRDIGNSFAARGGAFSGNALRGLTDFNQNLASEDYYNFVNQLNNMAGLGQTAANQSGGYAMQTGANIGQLLQNQGDARASGIAGQANIYGNAIGSLGQYWGQNPPSWSRGRSRNSPTGGS